MEQDNNPFIYTCTHKLKNSFRYCIDHLRLFYPLRNNYFDQIIKTPIEIVLEMKNNDYLYKILDMLKDEEEFMLNEREERMLFNLNNVELANIFHFLITEIKGPYKSWLPQQVKLLRNFIIITNTIT